MSAEALIIVLIICVLYLLNDGGWFMSKQLISNEALMAKLFRWKTSVDFNGVSFYLRVVSDATVEDARKYALLNSRQMRRSLRNSNTDEYMIYLDQYDDFTKSELNAFIQIAASKETMREYLSNNPRPQLDQLPDSPTQEQIEEYEAARQANQEEYIKTMQDSIEVWRVDFEKALDTQTEDALRAMARKYRTDEVCENVFNAEFEAFIVASSVYGDDKYSRQLFTVTEYKNLPTEVKDVLYNAYNNMNIAADDVKNS